jgi:glycosyltransferase involved in cell wall biosynthesis
VQSRLRFLFVKTRLVYPRSAGHDIRAFNMMRALGELGHSIGLVTRAPAVDEAEAGLVLELRHTLAEAGGEPPAAPAVTRLQARFASYFGVSGAHVSDVSDMARRFKADVVIGVGADILPYIATVGGARRVWYAGDEWVSHYCSLASLARPKTWTHLRTAAIWGLYQRAFVPSLDRVWLVSEREARAMRRWAGAVHADALANGLDAEYYAPQHVAEREHAAVFWGRLDFSPNLQALQWFCSDVWPTLRSRFPDALFRVIGFSPGTDAAALARIPGVVLSENLRDLRGAVSECGVAVMPFQSGGGVKNKLLEAAGMARAIVCTPLASGGLRGRPPLVLASKPEEWVEALSRLWTDADERKRLASEARKWVVAEHSWQRTAADALASLGSSTA